MQYSVNNAIVFCNPFGYPNEDTGFEDVAFTVRV
jgi:hypothetical protein